MSKKNPNAIYWVVRHVNDVEHNLANAKNYIEGQTDENGNDYVVPKSGVRIVGLQHVVSESGERGVVLYIDKGPAITGFVPYE